MEEPSRRKSCTCRVCFTQVDVEYVQGALVNNFRPVQPLNGRVVYRSFQLQDLAWKGGRGRARHHRRNHTDHAQTMDNRGGEGQRFRQASGVHPLVSGAALWCALAAWLACLVL